MFVGHYAVSLALENFKKRASLYVLFLSLKCASIRLPIQWPLVAEAASKLHNSLTPEIAFKHNVKRY